MILASKVQAQKPSQSKTILIVEDDETVAAFFQTLVNGFGLGTIVVHSGAEALLKLKSSSARKIDLMILDLMMPAPGGYEILKKLQDGDHQNVPVFVVTARDLDDGAVAILKLESNVKGFWKKPVDQDEFKKQLLLAVGAEN